MEIDETREAKMFNCRMFASLLLGTLIGLTNVQAAEINLPNTKVSYFEFSAMTLNTTVPALGCVVSGPKEMTATLAIYVFLFDTQDAKFPYATVSGNAAISPTAPRGTCNINNGQQTIPSRTPARIEIQLTTTTAILGENVSVTVPAGAQK